MSNILKNYRRLNTAKLAAFAANVQIKMENDKEFQTLAPFISKLSTSATAALNANSVAKEGNVAQKQAARAANQDLVFTLDTVANQVEAFSNGTALLIEAAGFKTTAKTSHRKGAAKIVTTAPIVFARYGSISGTILLKWTLALGSACYLIEHREDGNENWIGGDANKARNFKFENLVAGKRYFFRVRGIAPGGAKGDWSQVIEIWAV